MNPVIFKFDQNKNQIQSETGLTLNLECANNLQNRISQKLATTGEFQSRFYNRETLASLRLAIFQSR